MKYKIIYLIVCMLIIFSLLGIGVYRNNGNYVSAESGDREPQKLESPHFREISGKSITEPDMDTEDFNEVNRDAEPRTHFLLMSCHDLAIEMRDIHGLDAFETACELRDLACDCYETGMALQDVYLLSQLSTSDIMKTIDCSCVEIGFVMSDGYGLDYVDTADILHNLGCSCTEIGQTMRDVFKIEAPYTFKLLYYTYFCTDDSQIMDMLINVYNLYAAITDIRVHGSSTIGPYWDDKTGLTYVFHGDSRTKYICTEPFIKDIFADELGPGINLGTRLIGNDLNDNIGGSTATLWVKYELVHVDSTTRVLTDLEVTNWPDWDPPDDYDPYYCGSGWERASGNVGGVQGAITYGTVSGCNRYGLCVQYKRMRDTETFVSALSVSWDHDGEIYCPPLCEANRGYWVMKGDPTDIHEDCGDENWVHLCYNKQHKWPPMPKEIKSISEKDKVEILESSSPRIWFNDESYRPSAVEWTFPYLRRYQPCAEALPWEYSAWGCASSTSSYWNYWFETKSSICTSDVLSYFHGPSWTELLDDHSVPIYGFWNKQTIEIKSTHNNVDVVDLVYFVFYPYNRGKQVMGTTYGHHVGDWEHIVVRHMWGYDNRYGWKLNPVKLYMGYHSSGTNLTWGQTKKAGTISLFEVFDGTHPEVYVAWGSHGFWPSAGKHCYENTPLDPPNDRLYDYTWNVQCWDTWHNVETNDFNAKKGLGASVWPIWMGNDFTKDCETAGCDPEDPASGPIYRWGNKECGSVFGQCQLCDGPTGSVSKGVWKNWILE